MQLLANSISFALILMYAFKNEHFLFIMRKGEVELASIMVCPCPGPLLGLCSVLFLPFGNTHSTTLNGPPRSSVGGRGLDSKAEGAARPAGTPQHLLPGDWQQSQNGCSRPFAKSSSAAARTASAGRCASEGRKGY